MWVFVSFLVIGFIVYTNENKKNITIVPFHKLYPSLFDLDKKQYNSYKYIKSNINRNIYIDIKDNISYLYLYIYEIINNINNKKDITIAIVKLKQFQTLYPLINTNSWIGDLYYLSNNLEQALKYYEKNLDIKRTSTFLANTIFNIKYKLDIDISAKDLICLNKNFTKFIKNKYNEIEAYCEISLQKKKKDLNIDNYLKYIRKKYSSETTYCSPILCGIPYDLKLLDLNKKNMQEMAFYSINEVNNFCKDISREAENLLRTKMKIPKIGEGWIGETELYYKIKQTFPSLNIIPHYKAEWLGRQHLDIFIKELNIAFEYQGLQHFKPVNLFGGEEALRKNIKRDKIKASKCKRNKVCLYTILPDYNFDDIINIINIHLNS